MSHATQNLVKSARVCTILFTVLIKQISLFDTALEILLRSQNIIRVKRQQRVGSLSLDRSYYCYDI